MHFSETLAMVVDPSRIPKTMTMGEEWVRAVGCGKGGTLWRVFGGGNRGRRVVKRNETRRVS